MDPERFKNSPLGHLVPFSGVDPRTRREFSHWAYLADDLGDEPPLKSATWHAVTEARAALARLDQCSRQVPVPELLLRPTLSREAQSTSALEGTYAPLQDVLAASSDPAAPATAAMREILNYSSAAEAAYSAMRAQANITVGLLEQLHGILVRGTGADGRDSGSVRTTPVVIGSPSGAIEDARFVPMTPGPPLEAGLNALVEWIRRGGTGRDPVVAAALVHYQFETLHPFTDGNGRIGRLLIVLQFMADGLLSEPLLSVSPWFEERRIEYQEQLAAVSATGDWDAWVTFFARGVEASATDTARRVDRLLAIQKRYVEIAQRVSPRGGVIRDVAASLIGHPVVTVADLARRFDRTPQAMSAVVEHLRSARVLLAPTQQYNRPFIAVDVLETLSARPADVREPDFPLWLDGERF